MVTAMLFQHANNEWQPVQHGVPIVRSQATDKKITCASGYRFHPVVGAKRKEWNLLTAGVLRQHLKCGRSHKAV
jgi:hypothetical protein